MASEQPATALITGKGGSYLAELLSGKAYEVRGIMRRASRLRLRGAIGAIFSLQDMILRYVPVVDPRPN